MQYSPAEEAALWRAEASQFLDLVDQAPSRHSREGSYYITQQNAINSPLLRLPAEIKTIIFDYLFKNVAHEIDWWGYLEPVCYYYPSPDLTLLFVCRQLYHDTALLPYKLGVFYIEDDDLSRSLWEFLRKRTKAQIRAMARVKYTVYGDSSMDRTTRENTGEYWVANCLKE